MNAQAMYKEGMTQPWCGESARLLSGQKEMMCWDSSWREVEDIFKDQLTQAVEEGACKGYKELF